MMEQNKGCADMTQKNDFATDLRAEYDALRSDIERLETKAQNPLLRLFKKQDRKAALEELEEKRSKLALLESLYQLRMWLVKSECPESFGESVDKCIRSICFQRQMDDRAEILSVDALIKQTAMESLRALQAGEDCAILEHRLQCLKDYAEDRGNAEALICYKKQGFVECSRQMQELTRRKILLEAKNKELIQSMEELKKASANPALGLDTSEVVRRVGMIRLQSEKIRTECENVKKQYDEYESRLQYIKKGIACGISET